MGRYYSGDIEGKFWFGVQPSDDASFFGGMQSDPSFVTHHFDEDDRLAIDKGIAACEEALGENQAKLDAFFAESGKGYQGYTNKMVAEELGVTEDDAISILQWYARHKLGVKISRCVRDTGSCTFDADL